jgi:CHAT domain-containing protein
MKEAHSLTVKSTTLLRDYQSHGRNEDLEQAILDGRRSMGLIPVSHRRLHTTISNVGVMYGRRYEKHGDLADIDQAVKMADLALMVLPSSENQYRLARLNNLGSWLGRRFFARGEVQDLARAINITEEALGLASDGPQEASVSANLGNLLSKRYDRLGAVEDFNRAVDLAENAVNAMRYAESIDFTLQDVQVGLMLRLKARYRTFRISNDLDRAIELGESILDDTPAEHMRHNTRLSELSSIYSLRYDRSGNVEDLHRAIQLLEKTVDLPTFPDRPFTAMYKSRMADLLSDRFIDSEGPSDRNDIDQAVLLAEEVPSMINGKDFEYRNSLIRLGTIRAIRFEKYKDIKDMNRAIHVCEMAASMMPEESIERCGVYFNLGQWYSERYKENQDDEDMQKALSSYQDGLASKNIQPRWRLHASRRIADILFEQSKWSEAYDVLEQAIKGLPLVSPRFLENTDKQDQLAEFEGLASMAAVAALNVGKTPHQALELLEMGRGVISGLLMDTRTDVSDLSIANKELVKEFELYKELLDPPTNLRSVTTITHVNNAPAQDRLRQHQENSEKLDSIITQIRSIPGQERFLLPPSESEIMAAAAKGPIVIININKYRCDAFIIESHQIRLETLPSLSKSQIQTRFLDQGLKRTSLEELKWLWDVAARPILDALKYAHIPEENTWPRMWWVCTGVLSHIPIHAAGDHYERSGDTVLDRVMSSYTSSIKTLIHMRKREIHVLAPSQPAHAVLVSMRKTPGCGPDATLRYAEDEIAIAASSCRALNLRVLEPKKCKEAVIKALPGCRVFHFAGHGKSNPINPAESKLLLDDWKTSPLTVSSLRDYKVQHGASFLGYLSACETGRIEAGNLVDEGIHLVSALQLAGFKHVIGTLWEVSDKYSVDVTRHLYETLEKEGMNDTAVCLGLHRALRSIRDADLKLLRDKPAVKEFKSKEVDDATSAEVADTDITKSGNSSGAQAATSGEYVEDLPPGFAATILTTSGERTLKFENSRIKLRKARLLLAWAPYVHYGV